MTRTTPTMSQPTAEAGQRRTAGRQDDAGDRERGGEPGNGAPGPPADHGQRQPEQRRGQEIGGVRVPPEERADHGKRRIVAAAPPGEEAPAELGEAGHDIPRPAPERAVRTRSRPHEDDQPGTEDVGTGSDRTGTSDATRREHREGTQRTTPTATTRTGHGHGAPGPDREQRDREQDQADGQGIGSASPGVTNECAPPPQERGTGRDGRQQPTNRGSPGGRPDLDRRRRGGKGHLEVVGALAAGLDACAVSGLAPPKISASYCAATADQE